MSLDNLSILSTLSDGTGHYSQTVELDGEDFILDFDYNTIDSSWYLSVATSNGDPIEGCMGRRLVQNWFPLRLSRDSNRPKGELFVGSDTKHNPPTLLELGVDTFLYYIPKADLDSTL